MNKQEAIKRLEVIKKEAEELREFIKTPDQPEIKQGDVWRMHGVVYLITCCAAEWTAVEIGGINSGGTWDGTTSFESLSHDFQEGGAVRLGRYDDIFIQKDQVEKDWVPREALKELLEKDIHETEYLAGYLLLSRGITELLNGPKNEGTNL